MKRTARLLAISALATLILASCSTGDTNESNPQSGATEQAEEAADESDAWPIVEDEDGNVVENPEEEDAPMDDGGDDTAFEEGNVTSVEFGDQSYDFDMDALMAGAYPTDAAYYLEGMTGVKAIAEIGVEGPPGLEAYRASIGADPVTYIRFDVDNRQGTEEILMLELNMYDAEGQEYKFETMTSAKNDWSEDIEDYTDEQYELSQDTEDYDGAAVGQRNEQWLVGPADFPDDVAVMHAISEAFSDEFYPMPLI